MSDLTFDNLARLNLLWLVLAAAAVGVYGIWRRRRALRAFADAPLLPRLAPPAGWMRPLARVALVALALVFLVAALVGPRWGQQTQALLRRNVDVMVLLDVSRSMLARDIAPNRLERAKLAIRDDLLPSLGGDRIGLVTFAGLPSRACPLTADYGFFRLALDDVTTQSSPRGGTLIGDAIRKAGELLASEKLDSHKLIILITDGEDQESFPVEAAAGVWKDQQIPIVALALGDPQQGARIPVAGENGGPYLTYGGQEVWSKADFAMLEKAAHTSPHGIFVPVGTSNFDLGAIYRKAAGAVRAEEAAEQRHVSQPSRAHPFAVVALLLVLIDSFLPDGPRRARVASTAGKARERAAA